MKHLFTLCFLTVLCTCVSAQNADFQLTESVYFSSAGHEPGAAELEKLAAFASTLSSYAGYTLKVEAFTDEKGTEAYNEALAERRANAIATALALQNIVPTTAEILSYGEQRARQNTTHDAERKTDRRVDLVAMVTPWQDAASAINAARATQLQKLQIEDPTQRQTIAGKKGGTFTFEANALLRPDGTPATGPVSLELTEAYDLSDMLIAGLTTTSAGKRLETGGMMNLVATDADGEALTLRDGAPITASVPTDDFNERMRIFSGAGHDENGTPTDWALTTGGVANSAAGLLADLPPLPMPAFYRLKAEQNIGRRMRQWRNANPEPSRPKPEFVDENFLSRKPQPVKPEEIVYQPKGLQAVFMSKAKRAEKTTELREKAEGTYVRHLERYERAVVYFDGTPERNEVRLAQYETDLADWNKRFQATKESLMSKEMLRLRAAAEVQRKKYLAARAARTREIGERLAQVDDLSGQESNISRYFFSISNLGWANIDIYYEGEDQIQLLAEIEKSTPKATVVMVPTDRRSVIAYRPGLEANTWQRGGIPRGIGYHVIAYQVLEGKLVMAHEFISSANDQQTAMLTYQPVAVLELQEKLDGILGR